MPRVDSLTGLRWWAAFAVFAFHMANLAPLPIARALGFGNYGVAFFFVLSGFVLTWSASDRVSTGTFYVRRFARIYPAYVVALIVAIPIFYSVAPDPAQSWVKPVDVGVLALSFVLLQGWWRDPAVLFSGNPVAWTLSCEAFFYALHPAIGRAFSRVRAKGALIGAGAMVAVLLATRIVIVVAPGSWFAHLPWPILRLPEFVLGMALAWAMRCGWRPKVRPMILLVMLGAAFLAWYTGTAMTARFPSTAPLWPFVTEFVVILFALLIASVAAGDLAGRWSFTRNRWSIRLGEISYSFYLVHSLLIYAVLALVGPQPMGWRNIAWYGGMLVLGILAAAALHHGVEKPLERVIRRAWDRRRERRAVDVAA